MTDTTRILRHPRTAALCLIALGVAAASAASFAESYRGLYQWAVEHGIGGNWARMWPLQVDVFIAVGELTLFVALCDDWPPRSRYAAWAVTALGVAASVAGNIGHGTAHAWTSRATDAVPPLAAAAALAVALGVLKRVARYARVTTGTAPDVAPVTVPDIAATQDAPEEATPETADVVPVAAPKVTPAVTSRAARTAPKKTTGSVAPRQKARDIRDAEPDITSAELARRVGVNVRTLQRWQGDAKGGTEVSPPHALNGAAR